MTMKCAGLVLCAAMAAQAGVQVWDDTPDGVWDLATPNWTGAAWIDGNTAAFTGTGGVVEVDGAVTAAGLAFGTDGYTIADADGDATLTLAGTPVIEVTNAGHTNTVGVAVAGTAGFTKTGAGVLQLTAANTYSGEVVVAVGILRLRPHVSDALGVVGDGNGTVVENGATLDFNGAYAGARGWEAFAMSGSGVDGLGAVINTGNGHVNNTAGFLSLNGDTVIGGPNRIDFHDITGNNRTLTKKGGHELCVQTLTDAELVIDEGMYTILNNGNALGGTTWGDTTVNGSARLHCWGANVSVPERITFNGGRLSQGAGWGAILTLNGHITVNDNVSVDSGDGNNVMITGFVDGPGGFTQNGNGPFILANPTNTYTGPTLVPDGKRLFVGQLGGNAGSWGQGVLTNYGNVYFREGASGCGPAVNMSGGRLFFDDPCVFTSNTVSGAGKTYVRYGADAVLDAGVFNDDFIFINDGHLTLTNGAVVRANREFILADLHDTAGHTGDVTTVNATLTIHDGCLLEAPTILAGNGNSGTSLTGRIVQVGGTVLTTGYSGNPDQFSGEYDGLHLGHWPACHEFVYEMRGGWLIVSNDYRLTIAVDGQGWFLQTGGEVSAATVMVNGRDNWNGYGRLTLEGGALNVGSGGINAGANGPYLVEYVGGTVRAVTNFASSLNATMLGTGAGSSVFDTREWGVTLSGNLTGTGGLGKAGSGTLTLTGANTYAGGTRVLAGKLLVNDRTVLPDGAMDFGVAPDDAGGRVHSSGDLSLDGLIVGVANPEALDKRAQYTIATWGGTLTAEFSGTDLPTTWKVGYNRTAKHAYLFADVGTVMQLR